MHTYLLALAQAAPQSHEPQLLDIDGTLFIQFGLFLVTVFILRKWLWQPYLRVRGERVTRIDGYRAEAARLEAEAASRLTRCDADLAEARRVGSAARNTARAEARTREQVIIAEAQQAAQKALAEAGAKLATTLAAERSQLQAKAQELGREAGRRILGREVMP